MAWNYRTIEYLRFRLEKFHNLSKERSNHYALKMVAETGKRKTFFRRILALIGVFGLNRIPVDEGKLVGVVPIEVEFNGLTMRFHLPKELFGTESDMVLSISFLSIYGPEMTIFEEDGSSWRGMEPILLENIPSPRTVINTIVGLSVEAGGYPGVPGVCRLCKECGNLRKLHMFTPSQLNKGRHESKCKNCVDENTRSI
jgi:hypothetical protein